MRSVDKFPDMKLHYPESAGCTIVLPTDIVVANKFEAHAPHQVLPANQCPDHGMILEAGPASIAPISDLFPKCQTLICNGPLGAFEIEPFDAATNAASLKTAALTRSGQLVSVAGGGDVTAALNASGAAKEFSYISTAGGAFLEWKEGKVLPGVAALIQKDGLNENGNQRRTFRLFPHREFTS